MMILTFELRDDPGVEHEAEVENLAAARVRLQGSADMVVWADLTDTNGVTIADTGLLV